MLGNLNTTDFKFENGPLRLAAARLRVRLGCSRTDATRAVTLTVTVVATASGSHGVLARTASRLMHSGFRQAAGTAGQDI